MKVEQDKVWTGAFGKEYTDRNEKSISYINDLYLKTYGISCEDLAKQFLADVPRDIRVLEVGCGTGTQLSVLSNLGFSNLYGLDIQDYAIEQVRLRSPHIEALTGSIFDIPFKDKYFDLVFTSGLLIHISPLNISKALQELYRCTNRYIWGHEYFSERMKTIEYRGRKDLMWKADYCSLLTTRFSRLRLVDRKIYEYSMDGNKDKLRDIVYLLEKK